jgi:hypothetical protein
MTITVPFKPCPSREFPSREGTTLALSGFIGGGFHGALTPAEFEGEIR